VQNKKTKDVLQQKP